jgi:hypothetical protein
MTVDHILGRCRRLARRFGLRELAYTTSYMETNNSVKGPPTCPHIRSDCLANTKKKIDRNIADEFPPNKQVYAVIPKSIHSLVVFPFKCHIWIINSNNKPENVLEILADPWVSDLISLGDLCHDL